MDKDYEEEKGKRGAETLAKIYRYTINGLPNSKPANVVAHEYLSKYGNKEKAMEVMVRNQVAKCTTTGFLTGLGGFITLPVTLPADLASSMYIQMRMIAAIAVMNGYQLQDDAVQTMVYAALLGVKVGDLFKQVGVKTTEKMAMAALKKLPGKVLTRINQKLGFRFITKFGEKGVVNLAKGIPLLGGFVNGTLNLAETMVLAKKAMKDFSE